MAIGASPTVQPHPTVTRYRFVALWFSAGIVVSVLISWRFLNYRELPHLYQELQHLVRFAVCRNLRSLKLTRMGTL